MTETELKAFVAEKVKESEKTISRLHVRHLEQQAAIIKMFRKRN